MLSDSSYRRAAVPPRVIVVAGPTASGKSALALAIAERFGGTVINADSMQVYRELRILTARPSPEEEARVPHRLYGHLSASEPWSVGRWRAAAVAAIEEAVASGRLPVVTGGTGLYIRALMHGLSPIPDVPEASRAAAVALHGEIGGAALHHRLVERDAETAVRLRPTDTQRLIRAWEVLEATGQGLAAWRRQASPIEGFAFLPFVMSPSRPWLYARCDGRLVRMVADGALDEVAALEGFDTGLPAMKALGVPDFRRYLRGEIPLERALERAQQATRNFAKRQTTWFRHQMPEGVPVDAQFSERSEPEIFPIIDEFLLTGSVRVNRFAPSPPAPT